jgi:hypothetical protein
LSESIEKYKLLWNFRLSLKWENITFTILMFSIRFFGTSMLKSNLRWNLREQVKLVKFYLSPKYLTRRKDKLSQFYIKAWTPLKFPIWDALYEIKRRCGLVSLNYWEGVNRLLRSRFNSDCGSNSNLELKKSSSMKGSEEGIKKTFRRRDQEEGSDGEEAYGPGVGDRQLPGRRAPRDDS